ncbi:Leucine-rich repeat containing protein [Entamoeba histolytica HM-3:IMSS]|uniref:Leucine-rich repeat containing protein n=3 Tax=Entamoeba histolytica TaxID=5759 RepID=A0A175JQ92_ENTHI|nr:leucinerich repeat-containing protein [Entamoeba histolytica KU27]EMS13443.1 Leucine-rich repeat containing protein [Entamoeba histolytica HM-3:IMSS]GAT95901.1 leucine-rich repeat containing protein [Entamoeba histolytica]
MEEIKRPIEYFRNALFKYFDKYLREITMNKGMVKMSLPLAMFLSGISFDVYSENETIKAERDEVFKYLKKVQIKSLYNKRHRNSVNPLSFILTSSINELVLSDIPSTFILTDQISHHLVSLKVENCPFSLDSFTTEWPFLTQLVIQKASIRQISPFIFTKTKFPVLKKLDLQHNCIKVLENIDERPFDELILANNYIQHISVLLPGSISLLDLSFNQLTEIKEISKFFNLRELNLSNNDIYFSDEMRGIFNKMYSLTNLHFENNQTVNYRQLLIEELPSVELGLNVSIDGLSVQPEERYQAIDKVSRLGRSHFEIEKNEEEFTEKIMAISKNQKEVLVIEKKDDVALITSEAKREMRLSGNALISIGNGNIECHVKFGEEDADFMIQEIYKLMEKLQNKHLQQEGRSESTTEESIEQKHITTIVTEKPIEKELNQTTPHLQTLSTNKDEFIEVRPIFNGIDITTSDSSDKSSSSMHFEGISDAQPKKQQSPIINTQLNVSDNQEQLTGESTSSDSVNASYILDQKFK